MSSRVPPRHVPTLTEVVHPATAAAQAPPTDTAAGSMAAPNQPAISEHEIVQRVMRRVDETLERRLREAVAAAVIEQMRALGPMLQDEIETVVRQAVAEAFQQELGRTRG